MSSSIASTAARIRIILVLFGCVLCFLARGVFSAGYYDSANLLLGFFPWRAEATLPPAADMNPLLTDQPTQFLLWHRFAADEIRAGRLPVWNPWSGAGRPLLANSQSAVFSPANVGHYLFGERAGLLWAAAWRLLCAGLGMWVLARRVNLGESAAAFAAVSFAFCGPMVVWLGHPQSAVFAMFPWLLAAAHALALAPGPSAAVGAAVAIALAFVTGHPESTFHVIVCAALWGAWLLVVQARHRAATVAWTVVAVLVGGALAAAHWLPFLEYLSHSDAWALRQAGGGHGAPPVPVLAAIAWLVPNVFGHPQGAAFAWPDMTYHDITAYAGLLAPLLAVRALATRQIPVAVIGLGVVGGIAALGVYGIPPVSWLLDALPLFRSSYNNRLLVVAVAAVVLVAAHAVEHVRLRPLPRPVLLAGGVTGALLLGVGLFGNLQLGAVCVRAGAVLLGGSVALAAGTGAVGLLLVAGVDLLSWGYRYNPVTPPEQHFLRTPFIAELQREIADDPQARLLARGYILPSETPMRYGLRDVKSWDAVEPARYARYLDIARDTGRGAGVPVAPTTRLALYRTYHARLLDAAAMAVVLSEEPLGDTGLRLIAKAPGVYAYRNGRALPRARFTPAVEVVASAEAAAARLGARGHDPARLTLLEGAPAGIEAGGQGTVTFLADEPTHVRLRVEADAPAILVLADVMFPGWTAAVDGQAADLWYADLAFRAVAVPAGAHVVAFHYRPASVRAGVGLSAIGLGVALVLGVWGRRVSQAGRAGSG